MLSFDITKLDIHQSYFVGKVLFRGDEYTINIQDQRRGKVLKLPFDIESKKEQMIVRLTGPTDAYVEDYLPYCGRSEWLEIDSDGIAYYLADHQDQFDTLEIMDE
ncbi:MAG: hypothetical protein GWO20_07675 [Candidatus Korarchaeota archaeon]|nr:hypothetical protein [Candidatus Korarchaeota archaeon]